MPSPHSGTMSSDELQSGVISRPKAWTVPSPNQMIGALEAARSGVKKRKKAAARLASATRKVNWKTTRVSAITASTAMAATRRRVLAGRGGSAGRAGWGRASSAAAPRRERRCTGTPAGDGRPTSRLAGAGPATAVSGRARPRCAGCR